MRSTRVISLVALVVGLTLLSAAPATAHGVKFARSVGANFIPDSGPPFTAVTGKVSAGNPACKRASRVTLWQNQPGKDIDFGSRRTTKAGFFTISSPGTPGFPDGSYYLTVKRKVLAKNRFHRHICPGLKTGSFSITNP